MPTQVHTDLHIATMADGAASYGFIEGAALVIEEGVIAWVGKQKDLPLIYADIPQKSWENRLLTPGLIDCHTHVVFGGNRAHEFDMRLKGASYAEIALQGGGIVSTVTATRGATEAELLAAALPRIDAMLANGVCVIEVKSGYGLDVTTELKMLSVARAIERARPVKIVTSFLGAHAVPPEYKGRADHYIQEVCLPALQAAHTAGLVDGVDGFCEGIAFSPSQIGQVFAYARSLHLPVKLHAEQLSNLGGAKLAAQYGALSADHLEYLDEEGVIALARAHTVAVLLPGAFYSLREKQLPPLADLRKHGVAIAVATDCNPGSSPMTSLLLAMNMACTLFQMTPLEALRGVTVNAAQALGLKDYGMIRVGTRANFAIWNAHHPAELSYHIGFNPLHARIYGGKW